MRRRFTRVLALLAAVAIGGCSADLTQSLALTQSAPGLPQPELVVFKPIAGPPESVTSHLVIQLNAAASRGNIALLIDADARAPRTLVGNVWLRPDASGLKLVYVWDVLDGKGERISRTRGEDPIGPATANQDAWSLVTVAQLQAMAGQAMAALGTPASN